MIAVPMLESGPDMDIVEARLREDATIRGMWCVPRFSNPTGCVYSDETVERIAGLAHLAADDFLVLWDNAYAVHALYDDAPPLASLRAPASARGTLDSVFQFGSTSKITFAGAGVGFAASSPRNLQRCRITSPCRRSGRTRSISCAMCVSCATPSRSPGTCPGTPSSCAPGSSAYSRPWNGNWAVPAWEPGADHGAAISYLSTHCPGLAREVVRLATDIGVKLTPAGATFPYGDDPRDTNIRLAPTYPTLEEVDAAAGAFALCVKLATLRDRTNRPSA